MELDIQQMRSACKLSTYWNIEDFFQKKIKIVGPHGDLGIDLSYLSKFDDRLLKFIKKTESNKLEKLDLPFSMIVT